MSGDRDKDEVQKLIKPYFSDLQRVGLTSTQIQTISETFTKFLKSGKSKQELSNALTKIINDEMGYKQGVSNLLTKIINDALTAVRRSGR